MPAILASIPWWVWVIIVIALLIGALELAAWLLYKYVWTACQLRRGIVTRDKCGGTCPPGQVCVSTGTRPYGPFGWFGLQDTACACGAPGTGVPGGTGGPPGGTGGTPPGGGGTGSGTTGGGVDTGS